MVAGSIRSGSLDAARPLLGAALFGLCAILGVLAGLQPPLAIGGALAVAFALVAMADLAAGIALWVPFAFLYPGVLGKPLLAALLVLAIGSLAAAVRRRETVDRHDLVYERRTMGLLAVFLAWAMVSVTWAENADDGLLDVARFLLSALLLIAVWVAVRDRRDARIVLAAYLVGATAAALAALAALPDPDTGRLTGAGARDPNLLAASVLAAVAIAGAAVVALRGSPALRLGVAAMGMVCFLAFLGTASRGGLIALAVMLVAGVAFAGRWRAAVVLVAGCAVGLTVVYFTAIAAPELRERIIEPGKGEVQVQESRLTLWDVGWRIVTDKPVAGVGVGNFSSSAVSYLFEPEEAFRSEVILDEQQPAHNTYLHVLAELGVVGGALLLAFVGACLWSSLAAVRNFARIGDREMEALARGLLVGQAGICAAIFFLSAQTVNEVWLLLALGPALAVVSRAAARRAERGLEPPPQRRVVVPAAASPASARS